MGGSLASLQVPLHRKGRGLVHFVYSYIKFLVAIDIIVYLSVVSLSMPCDWDWATQGEVDISTSLADRGKSVEIHV